VSFFSDIKSENFKKKISGKKMTQSRSFFHTKITDLLSEKSPTL
jgi:hypothetical protein